MRSKIRAGPPRGPRKVGTGHGSFKEHVLVGSAFRVSIDGFCSRNRRDVDAVDGFLGHSKQTCKSDCRGAFISLFGLK